jgi:two-component system cell cycle sensor histidine kinase/response regulator CckA
MADTNPNGPLILVVDDESTALRSVTAALAMDGFRVIVAENGLAALEAFMSSPGEFALVLTDVVMPVMDGMSLAEKIHALCPEMPIVLMTGYSDAVLSTLSGPQFPLIRKPFLADHLVRIVRQNLGPAAGGSD